MYVLQAHSVTLFWAYKIVFLGTKLVLSTTYATFFELKNSFKQFFFYCSTKNDCSSLGIKSGVCVCVLFSSSITHHTHTRTTHA